MNGPSVEFLKSIIVDSKLFFSTPAAFNDPFDSAPALSMVATDVEFAVYLEGIFKRKYSNLARHERRKSIAAIVKDPARNHSSLAVQYSLKTASRNFLIGSECYP